MSLGDHDAITLQVQLVGEVVSVPKKIVLRNRSVNFKDQQEVMTIVADQILRNGVGQPTGKLILEYEIAMWEIREKLLERRTIPRHRRIRNFSRQMS